MAGMVLQRVHIGGFTESGSFTSLAFDDQDRNSAVSRLGYQVTFDAGAFRPFAKAVWNHEFADTDRTVTAYLTTITAPGFSMPAVVLGKDWGTGKRRHDGQAAPTASPASGVCRTFAQDNVDQLRRAVRT